MGIRLNWFKKPDPCKNLVKRVEELETALDHIARVAMGSETPSTRTRWITARAVSALDQDDHWREVALPKRYHDALERTTQDYL